MRMSSIVSACCAALLSVAGVLPAHADEGAKQPAQIHFEMREPVKCEEFLRQLNAFLGGRLHWDANEKVIQRSEVRPMAFRGAREDLLDHIRTILIHNGLVLTQSGSPDAPIYFVHSGQNHKSLVRMRPEYVEITPDSARALESKPGSFVTTTIRVKHMSDLRSARNALTRIVTGQNIGNVTEVPEAKSFIVTDFAPSVVACWRLIQAMDVPNPATSVTSLVTEAIAIKHGQAGDLANVLTLHFSKPTQPKTTGRNTAVPPQPQSPRITADARSNQILVRGTEQALKEVRRVVALIDVELPGDQATRGVMEVFRVAHADPEDIASALVGTFDGMKHLWQGGQPSVAVFGESDIVISGAQADVDQLLALARKLDGAAK